MRAGRKVLAMMAVGAAMAMSVSYVIPNAATVATANPAETAYDGADAQVAAPVTPGAAGAAIARDSYGVTDKPEPTPPPVVAAEAPVAAAEAPPAAEVSYALSPSTSSAELQWPVPPSTVIASSYGPRSCAMCSSFHEGADFSAPAGSPAFSMAAGVVTVINAPNWSALGTHVRVQHVIDGQQVESVYAHLQEGSLQVSVGDSVTAGQPLGAVGCTGRCSGTHLHFEIRPGGAAVDPVAWLSARLG
ncbi:M23 family metallopeptidase [Marisediminicola sp. LYQ134]|uniref:M23 family metallopeptidase n=1 Tax=unclassified Marisediminicola TaxID=2618316 RepID=UPI003982F2EF